MCHTRFQINKKLLPWDPFLGVYVFTFLIYWGGSNFGMHEMTAFCFQEGINCTWTILMGLDKLSNLISSHISVCVSSTLPILNFVIFQDFLLFYEFVLMQSSWKFLVSLVCLVNLSSRSEVLFLALFPVIVVLSFPVALTHCLSWFTGLWPSGWSNSILFIFISLLNTMLCTRSIQTIFTDCWLCTKHCTMHW